MDEGENHDPTSPKIMKRGGHSSPAAALRYQHATMDRDRDPAGRLAALAPHLSVVREEPSHILTDKIRTMVPSGSADDAIITPLTSSDTEQSQRGSNPCLHLERVVS